MSERVKIALIGTGFMGQKAHLDNYMALPDCEVVAFVEGKDGLRADVQRKYNIPCAFKTMDELFAYGDFQGVVASQPYANHVNVVPVVLKNKKHLLTEKPIAIAPETGAQFVELAKQNGVHYMVGYHKRSDLAMEYAKRVIEEMKNSGQYGKMRMVKALMPPGDWIGGHTAPICSSGEQLEGITYEPMPPYYDAATADKYNAFVNYYIHQVNGIRFLLGEPYKIVFGDRSGVLLVGESDSGVCTTIEMAAYNNTVDWQEAFVVTFDKAFVHIQLPAPLAQNIAGTVTVMRDDGEETPTFTIPMLPKVHAMRNQAANFIKVIQGEIDPPCCACEAVADLELAKAYIDLMCNY